MKVWSATAAITMTTTMIAAIVQPGEELLGVEDDDEVRFERMLEMNEDEDIEVVD
jgi:hypothetical protein